MIFMFANVLLFDDMFNAYELQEKQNIEYYWGHIAKSKKIHVDLVVPKVGILNISKDVEQKLMFSMVGGRGWRAGCK